MASYELQDLIQTIRIKSLLWCWTLRCKDSGSQTFHPESSFVCLVGWPPEEGECEAGERDEQDKRYIIL